MALAKTLRYYLVTRSLHIIVVGTGGGGGGGQCWSYQRYFNWIFLSTFQPFFQHFLGLSTKLILTSKISILCFHQKKIWQAARLGGGGVSIQLLYFV